VSGVGGVAVETFPHGDDLSPSAVSRNGIATLPLRIAAIGIGNPRFSPSFLFFALSVCFVVYYWNQCF